MKTLAVLLPTFNAAHFLSEAIDSVLNQTYTDFDFYIIDDGSTDNTQALIESFSDSRIIYLKNDKNLGLAATLNRGLKKLATNYEFIARMDADDWCFPNRFEKQLSLLQNYSEIMMCGTQGYWLKDFKDQVLSPWTYPNTYKEIKYHLLFSACFGHSSIIIRSEFLNNNNLKYNERVKTCEDWDLWIRLINLGEIVNLPDFLMKYRIVKNSNHRSRKNTQLHLEERSKVIANHWHSFNIDCDETFIYNVYYNENPKSKAKLKSDISGLISISNKIYEDASWQLNKGQMDRLKYRLLRNIKRTWVLSKNSRLSINVWLLILKKVNFSGVFNTFKTVIK